VLDLALRLMDFGFGSRLNFFGVVMREFLLFGETESGGRGASSVVVEVMASVIFDPPTAAGSVDDDVLRFFLRRPRLGVEMCIMSQSGQRTFLGVEDCPL